MSFQNKFKFSRSKNKKETALAVANGKLVSPPESPSFFVIQLVCEKSVALVSFD